MHRKRKPQTGCACDCKHKEPQNDISKGNLLVQEKDNHQQQLIPAAGGWCGVSKSSNRLMLDSHLADSKKAFRMQHAFPHDSWSRGLFP